MRVELLPTLKCATRKPKRKRLLSGGELNIFHIYVYGHEFVLVTNHKPLETIHGNRTSKTSARIERWVLRLQPYSFTVQYKTGRENPAHYLSGHPTSRSIKQQRMTEAHIDMIVQASVPKTLTLKEIEGATDGDHTLRAKH